MKENMEEIKIQNYDFKKTMKRNIEVMLEPFLYLNNFRKSRGNTYIREINKIVQIICFRVEKDRLKAFAMYFPIFIPFDNLLNYGIEITGTSGLNLLGGKYFTTIFEQELLDKTIQFEEYNERLLPDFKKLVCAIREGIIPEMDKMNSLEQFIRKFDNKQVKFFECEFDNMFRNHEIHRYVVQVNRCINGEFEKGKEGLQELKEDASEQEIIMYIQRLLVSKGSKLTKDEFIKNLEDICNERRKKYKLVRV